MSREIKFRAWSKAFDQMIQWEDMKLDKGEGESEICFYEQADGSDSIWDGGADYELMQLTGNHARNGAEIYEGDIVDKSYISPMTGKKVIMRYIIEWEKGLYRMKFISNRPEYDRFLWMHDGEVEVIGNIYENPEILEGESHE